MKDRPDQDPRDKKYYQFQKRGIENLSITELSDFLEYAEKIGVYVGHSKARRGWKDLAIKATARIESLS